MSTDTADKTTHPASTNCDCPFCGHPGEVWILSRADHVCDKCYALLHPPAIKICKEGLGVLVTIVDRLDQVLVFLDRLNPTIDLTGARVSSRVIPHKHDGNTRANPKQNRVIDVVHDDPVAASCHRFVDVVPNAAEVLGVDVKGLVTVDQLSHDSSPMPGVEAATSTSETSIGATPGSTGVPTSSFSSGVRQTAVGDPDSQELIRLFKQMLPIPDCAPTVGADAPRSNMGDTADSLGQPSPTQAGQAVVQATQWDYLVDHGANQYRAGTIYRIDTYADKYCAMAFTPGNKYADNLGLFATLGDAQTALAEAWTIATENQVVTA